MSEKIQFSKKLLTRLASATHIAVLTGAGISAPSGVPTFRGNEGLWKKFSPAELANLNAFMRNPELVWEWYNWRRELIARVKPNLAHYALVDLEKIYPEVTIITQNVDNLHQLAGSRNVIELHGNIMRSKCLDCHLPASELLDFSNGLPRCHSCNGLIRPDVVWFGEILPRDAVEEAHRRASESEVFFSIGTSATVEPAASIPYLAKGNGAYLVEINPESTPLSGYADESIMAPAHEVLPELIIYLRKIISQRRRTNNSKLS